MPLKVTTRKGRKGLWITGTVKGVRVRESAGTDNRALAEDIKARREQDIIRADLYGQDAETTFAQAAVAYLQDEGSPRFLKKIILAIGERRLGEIRPGEVRTLAIRLYPDATNATRNRQAVAPFLAVLNHACEAGNARPLKVKRFPEGKVEKKAIGRDWIDAFRRHCQNPWIKALALFVHQTGARLGSALDLEPSGFDPERRTATVKTKNGDIHTFDLSEECAAELATLKPRSGRVFGYVARRHIYKPWRDTCEAAGIEYIPPHQAGRHSMATTLIVDQGEDVATVAKLGGWKSTKLLMDRYVHARHTRGLVERAYGKKK